MDIRICCVVVLYKMKLGASRSFRSIYAEAQRVRDAEIDFFVFDNSPDADEAGAATFQGHGSEPY